MGLASACDICVASEQAVFATSEVKFGIIPSAISPYVIRAIGERQSYRYFQSAERISARVPARSASRTRSRASTNWMRRCRRSSAHCWLAAPGPRLQPGPDPRGGQQAGLRRGGGGYLAAHRRPACHAGSKGGLSAFLEKRPASWLPAA